MSKSAPLTIWLAAAGLVAGCTAPKGDPRPLPVSVNPTPPAIMTTPTAPSTAPADPADPAVATIGTTRVTRSELIKPLLEAYGFNMLMLIVQREMARDACTQQGIKVTPADVKAEYDLTLAKMFPTVDSADDRERLIEQFLAQPKPRDQMATRTELDIIVETNACLRKIVEPNVSRAVTDEMLKKLYDETYGSKARVRHIVTDNPQDAMAARRRLDAGEDFAKVAEQVSRDPQTRRLGGEMPPFTKNDTRVWDNFKTVAFGLKPGEVSDLVQAGGGYHLIKLEQIIDSKAVKFEDVKASLRQDYEANVVQEGVNAVKKRLAQQALAQLKITEPTLKAEFDNRVAAHEALIRDREKMREQMEKDREAARAAATTRRVPPAGPTTATAPLVPPPATTTQPTTASASLPTPTTQPATAPSTRP